MKLKNLVVFLAIVLLLAGCESTTKAVGTKNNVDDDLVVNEMAIEEVIEETEEKEIVITKEDIQGKIEEEMLFITTFNEYVNDEAEYITLYESTYVAIDDLFGGIDKFYEKVDGLYSVDTGAQLVKSLGVIEEGGRHYVLGYGLYNFASSMEQINIIEGDIPGYNRPVIIESISDTSYINKKLKDFLVEQGKVKLNTLPSGDVYQEEGKAILINRKHAELFVSSGEPFLLIEGAKHLDKIQSVLSESYKYHRETLNENQSEYQEEAFYETHWSEYNIDAQLGDTLGLAEWHSIYFHGAAHGMPSCQPYNFIISTGETYALADVFKEDFDYKKIINKAISQHFIENEFYGADDFDTIDDSTYFYFSKRGLTVYFDVYEYGPYSAGTQPVLIEFARLLDGINDTFKEKFMIVGQRDHLMTLNEREQVWADHAFEVNLTNSYGIEFVSPISNDEGNLAIAVESNGKEDRIYNSAGDHGYEFYSFKGISFPDVNGDGLLDIVFMAEYITGISDSGGHPFMYATVLFNSHEGFYQKDALKDLLINSRAISIPEVIELVKEAL